MDYTLYDFFGKELMPTKQMLRGYMLEYFEEIGFKK